MFQDPDPDSPDDSRKRTPQMFLSRTKKFTEDSPSSEPPEKRSDGRYRYKYLEKKNKYTALGSLH